MIHYRPLTPFTQSLLTQISELGNSVHLSQGSRVTKSYQNSLLLNPIHSVLNSFFIKSILTYIVLICPFYPIGAVMNSEFLDSKRYKLAVRE